MGLFIQGGEKFSPVSKNSLLGACVRLNKKGTLFLENSVRNCLHAFSAMQTGPLLIDQGNINERLAYDEKKSLAVKSV